MKRLILIILFSVGFLIIENMVTTAESPIKGCDYLLDLQKEECCVKGGDCCGPFCP